MRATVSSHPIRDAILLIELYFVCHAAFLRRLPLLRRLYRTVTADLRILPLSNPLEVGFEIEFRSPYFRIPVSVDKGQIGKVKSGQLLEASAFRLFDWHTWAHIEGNVEWSGERHTFDHGRQLELITGFGYRTAELPQGVGNLGLRLAEGVEGNITVACGRSIVQVGFEPVFWLLEAHQQGYRPVPIKSHRLMGLIVSLFEVGAGDPRNHETAVTHLCQWVEINLGPTKPFTGTREFLRYIRDWGPLGMEPLYKGIKDVMARLQVRDLERELFEFVADNWGVRGNRNGRLLSVKLLEILDTRPSRSALTAIYELVRNSGVANDELDLIRSIVDKGPGSAGSGSSASD